MNATTINEAIRAIMKERKITQQAMASALGKERPNDISARLNYKNMSFDRAIEMLSVCGYEVVVQEKKRGKRPDGQILIIQSDGPKKGGADGKDGAEK